MQLRVVADGPRDRGDARRPPRAAHRGRNRAMEVEQEKNHKIHFFSVEREVPSECSLPQISYFVQSKFYSHPAIL